MKIPLTHREAERQVHAHGEETEKLWASAKSGVLEPDTLRQGAGRLIVTTDVRTRTTLRTQGHAHSRVVALETPAAPGREGRREESGSEALALVQRHPA